MDRICPAVRGTCLGKKCMGFVEFSMEYDTWDIVASKPSVRIETELNCNHYGIVLKKQEKTTVEDSPLQESLKE